MRQPRREYWGQVITEQESSGLSIRAFCKQRGINDHSFYAWRRRLSGGHAVRFAELKTIAIPGSAGALELVLATGTRLRIPNLPAGWAWYFSSYSVSSRMRKNSLEHLQRHLLRPASC